VPIILILQILNRYTLEEEEEKMKNIDACEWITVFEIIITWVWNLVSHTKRTHIRGVWEQGAEKNIGTWEGWSGGRLENTA